MHESDREWDAFRIPGLVKLGSLLHRTRRDEVGGATYYRHSSGADVLAFGAVNFAWALDNYAAAHWAHESVDPRAQKLVSNLLNRWTSGAPAPGLPPVNPGASDGGTNPNRQPATAGDNGGGCTYGTAGASATLGIAAFAVWFAVMRRRLERANRAR